MPVMSHPEPILCCHWIATPEELQAVWPCVETLMAQWDYWHASDADTDLRSVFESYVPWVWLVTNRDQQAVACCALSDLDMDGRGWVFIHGAKLSAYRRHPLLRQLVAQVFQTAFQSLHCAWVLVDVMPGNLGALGFCRLWGLTPIPGLPPRETGRCYGLSREQFEQFSVKGETV